MVRCWRLIALALVGGLLLAFPSASSAGGIAAVIQLTPSGATPAALTLVLGEEGLVWQNSDTVTHTVTFANGLCSIQVPPGETLGCPIPWQVGQYSYAVDGTMQASITFVPQSRSVTLTARSHMLRRGAHLRLHGLLDYGTDIATCCFTDMPVMVLARHDRHHPFQQVANAATGKLGAGGTNGWPWWLDVHPKTTTIYIAEVNYQPDSGQAWQNATSKPFKVVVRANR